jgi:hypothetical protein
MKNLIGMAVAATLFIMTPMTARATELRIMKLDGKGTWSQSGVSQKVILVESLSVSGIFLSVGSESSSCLVAVQDLATAASLVGAISSDSIVECYTYSESQVNGRTTFLSQGKVGILKNLN